MSTARPDPGGDAARGQGRREARGDLSLARSFQRSAKRGRKSPAPAPAVEAINTHHTPHTTARARFSYIAEQEKAHSFYIERTTENEAALNSPHNRPLSHRALAKEHAAAMARRE